MSRINYQKTTCKECGQSTTYATALNKGIATIVQAFANFVRSKGINAVHPYREMLIMEREMGMIDRVNAGRLTHNQIKNLSHATRHGFITPIGKGNYCLTRKGASFLRGEPVPRIAIVRKRDHHNVGYATDENGEIICTINQLRKSTDPIWAGIDYEIEEGQVIRHLSELKQPELSAPPGQAIMF